MTNEQKETEANGDPGDGAGNPGGAEVPVVPGSGEAGAEDGCNAADCRGGDTCTTSRTAARATRDKDHEAGPAPSPLPKESLCSFIQEKKETRPKMTPMPSTT